MAATGGNHPPRYSRQAKSTTTPLLKIDMWFNVTSVQLAMNSFKLHGTIYTTPAQDCHIFDCYVGRSTKLNVNVQSHNNSCRDCRVPSIVSSTEQKLFNSMAMEKAQERNGFVDHLCCSKYSDLCPLLKHHQNALYKFDHSFHCRLWHPLMPN